MEIGQVVRQITELTWDDDIPNDTVSGILLSPGRGGLGQSGRLSKPQWAKTWTQGLVMTLRIVPPLIKRMMSI